LKAVEKWGKGVKGKGVGRTMEAVELTKVKYTDIRDTSRNPFEINNEPGTNDSCL
jgi:hypothetical protein